MILAKIRYFLSILHSVYVPIAFFSIFLHIKMTSTSVQDRRLGTSADVPDVPSPSSMLSDSSIACPIICSLNPDYWLIINLSIIKRISRSLMHVFVLGHSLTQNLLSIQGFLSFWRINLSLHLVRSCEHCVVLNVYRLVWSAFLLLRYKQYSVDIRPKVIISALFFFAVFLHNLRWFAIKEDCVSQIPSPI